MSIDGAAPGAPEAKPAPVNPYTVIADNAFQAQPSHPDLVERIISDPRMHGHVEGFMSCMQCGICTSGCPAARFADYSPREITKRALEGDPSLLEDDSVWLCFYCYTCQSRCPRGNSVAVINQIIRGLQVESGYGIRHVAMFADWADQFYERGMGGTPPEFLPDLAEAYGPRWRSFIAHRDEMRDELGLGSMYPSEGAVREVRALMDETGFSARLAAIRAGGWTLATAATDGEAPPA
ncbi:MAG TPA: 4Fe-4S dicluster domain-containing protein [Candidatus Binatia bacterium]|nr:4Fe-4S dicluster domain-containing protein [Candidatus Binatia bacterium]